LISFTEEEVERLAEMEMDGGMLNAFLEGWRYARKRMLTGKLVRTCFPGAKLSEESKRMGQNPGAENCQKCWQTT